MNIDPIVIFPGLPNIFSTEILRTADIPQRTWYWKPFFPAGLVLIVGKKRTKKSFFVTSVISAISAGKDFLGYPTTEAKTLVIHLELDLVTVHERLQMLGPQPEKAHCCFGWSEAEQALVDIETALTMLQYRVVVLDMMTSIAPVSLDSGHYISTTRFWNRLRRIAQNTNGCVIGLWHATKNARRDQVDEAMTSSGLVGQCDSVISLRRQSETIVNLSLTGNHALDKHLELRFDAGMWKLEKELLVQESSQTVGESANRCLDFITKHPEGVSSLQVALGVNGGSATRKEQDATRKTLERLLARGLVRMEAGHGGLKSYKPIEDTGRSSEAGSVT